jgi:transposase
MAALVVSEIGDVNRFPSSEKLCSYAGLVPSVRNSGDAVRHGRITREGSRWMRWAFTQAIQVHVSWDEGSKLSRFFRRLAARKTRQEAVVATARKMLKVMYWMLRRGALPFRWV